MIHKIKDEIRVEDWRDFCVIFNHDYNTIVNDKLEFEVVDDEYIYESFDNELIYNVLEHDTDDEYIMTYIDEDDGYFLISILDIGSIKIAKE